MKSDLFTKTFAELLIRQAGLQEDTLDTPQRDLGIANSWVSASRYEARKEVSDYAKN